LVLSTVASIYKKELLRSPNLSYFLHTKFELVTPQDLGDPTGFIRLIGLPYFFAEVPNSGHLRVSVIDSWLQAKKTTWETHGWSYNRKEAKNKHRS